jgi:hypothetical protein
MLQEPGKDTDDLTEVVAVGGPVVVDKALMEHMFLKDYKDLLDSHDIIGMSKQVKEECRSIGEKLRRLLWPRDFWCLMQKRGLYLRPYHQKFYTAMDSEFNILTVGHLLSGCNSS